MGQGRGSILSVRDFSHGGEMSDINVEDLVEAVAIAEMNAAHMHGVAVSLALDSDSISKNCHKEVDSDQPKRKRRHIERNRERSSEGCNGYYLIDAATCTDEHFQRRFGVTNATFHRLYFTGFAPRLLPPMAFSVKSETLSDG
jgi:hypothetical protein